MKILISGASGFLGSALVPFLKEKQHEIWRLVRTKETDAQTRYWDPATGVIEPLPEIDAVIHLSGENLGAERWSEAKKRRIRESRVLSTQLLSRTLAQMANPPKILLSASAIGYYGNRGEEILKEDAGPGKGFLSSVCQDWEASTKAAQKKGIRVVHLRFGLILSKQGGSLEKMILPIKMGLGGVIGNGKQYISWIAMDDALRAIQHILVSENLSGPINIVASEPRTNHDFTKILGHLLHRPTLAFIPAFAPKFMLGEMAEELLLSSTRVVPARLLESGFHLQYPDLENALRHLLQK